MLSNLVALVRWRGEGWLRLRGESATGGMAMLSVVGEQPRVWGSGSAPEGGRRGKGSSEQDPLEKCRVGSADEGSCEQGEVPRDIELKHACEQ